MARISSSQTYHASRTTQLIRPAQDFHWGDFTQNSEAHDAGADGCVLLDHAEFVTEGPGYNIFSIAGGQVSTPNCGVLEGVTRQSVIELCSELRIPCRVRPMPVKMQADEAFVTTTAGGPMPVSRIGGHIMGNDRPGPLSLMLRATFWRKREAGWHGTPVDYGDGPTPEVAGVALRIRTESGQRVKQTENRTLVAPSRLRGDVREQTIGVRWGLKWGAASLAYSPMQDTKFAFMSQLRTAGHPCRDDCSRSLNSSMMIPHCSIEFLYTIGWSRPLTMRPSCSKLCPNSFF